MSKPLCGVGYVRLSDLRESDLDEDGRGRGLVDQETRIRRRAADLGWTLARVVVENDLSRGTGKARAASAFKRRKVRLPNGQFAMRVFRPGFRAILEDIEAGRVDGLIALDLDRAVRDPRDLEDLIDAVEPRHIPVDSVTGSLRLATDADITMARIMCAVSNKESRDKSRRLTAARERQANDGQYGGGGPRPFGFDVDGITARDDECMLIEYAARSVVRGATLAGLARDLREAPVPTVSGAPWSAKLLRGILLRPRNKGVMVYQGVELPGAPCPWKPIVPPYIHDQVVRILTNPERDTRAGTAPRHLGSGIYRCGICDDGTPVQVTIGGRLPRYVCKAQPHLAISVANVDLVVVAGLMQRLRSPDAAGVIVPPRAGVDVAGLRGERAAIEERLAVIGGDIALGLLPRTAGLNATARGNARIAEIDRQLAEAAGSDPVLAELVRAGDPEKVWNALPLERRRMVLRELAEVRIDRAGPTGGVWAEARQMARTRARLTRSRWVGDAQTWGDKWGIDLSPTPETV